MATLKEVAKEAGVHKATASAVLNSGSGNTRVSEETVRRVREAAHRLGYVRNAYAAQLRKPLFNQVGFIRGDLRNPFFAEWTTLLEAGLRQRGLELLTSTSIRGEGEAIRACVNGLRQQKVSAICYWAELDELAKIGEFEAGNNCPLLHFGTVEPRTRGGAWIDLAEGTRQSVAHLARVGARRLGFFGPLASIRSPSFQTRSALFQTACAEEGLPEPIMSGYSGESWDVEAAAVGASSLTVDRVDGWLTFNDVAALGLLFADRAPRGRVVAFDGTMLIRAWSPSVPYLNLCSTKHVELLVEQITENIVGNNLKSKRIVPELCVG